jgi:putative chitinase
MNRRIFFNYVRNAPFGGRLLEKQIDGMNRILDEWKRRGWPDDRWLAYMLATVFWETAKTMQPVREGGGEAYLRSKRYYPWVGEGLVQVTWEANHKKFGATRPGQLMTWPIALRALFDGMQKGVFTGKALGDYFTNSIDDPRNARRIINGMDKADLIAGFHRQFLAAIKAAKEEDPEVEPDKATERNAEPDDTTPARDPGSLAVGGFSLAAIANAILSNIMENPLQYGTGGLVAVAVGVLAWMWWSGRITINRKPS